MEFRSPVSCDWRDSVGSCWDARGHPDIGRMGPQRACKPGHGPTADSGTRNITIMIMMIIMLAVSGWPGQRPSDCRSDAGSAGHEPHATSTAVHPTRHGVPLRVSVTVAPDSKSAAAAEWPPPTARPGPVPVGQHWHSG
eukprot:3447886-Rhodomonas_salina.2